MNAPYAIHHPSTLKRDERIPYTVPHLYYITSGIPIHLGAYSIPFISSNFLIYLDIANCNDW